MLLISDMCKYVSWHTESDNCPSLGTSTDTEKEGGLDREVIYETLNCGIDSLHLHILHLH
jgi:hypothetical protein